MNFCKNKRIRRSPLKQYWGCRLNNMNISELMSKGIHVYLINQEFKLVKDGKFWKEKKKVKKMNIKCITYVHVCYNSHTPKALFGIENIFENTLDHCWLLLNKNSSGSEKVSESLCPTESFMHNHLTWSDQDIIMVLNEHDKRKQTGTLRLSNSHTWAKMVHVDKIQVVHLTGPILCIH